MKIEIENRWCWNGRGDKAAPSDPWTRMSFDEKEYKSLFLGMAESTRCMVRNGNEWRRSQYLRVLRPEVFHWMTDNFGHHRNQVWECDRIYYQGELLPDLPNKSADWIKKFNCYYGLDGRWEGQYYSSTGKHISYQGTNPQCAVLFKMLFL